MTNNSIMVLKPYRYAGAWVFDDPETGLVREPFVAGIDEILDRMTEGIPDAESGFRLTFSASPFPDCTTVLQREGRSGSDCGGTWYWSPYYEIRGWLCPALFRYFPEAPTHLYARADALRP